MRRTRSRSVALRLALGLALTHASLSVPRAASLQVSPLLVDKLGTETTAKLVLRNPGPRAINAQIRIFRWTQVGGQDLLSPTRDVVVSPPMTRLDPGADYTVRIVRTAAMPAAAEEAYRVLVDELPDRSGRASDGVALVVRQSIPVFFGPQISAGPKLRWGARLVGGRLTVSAWNEGSRRARLSHLVVSRGSARTVVAEGLAGYALAGSSIAWTRPAGKLGAGTMRISAQGSEGLVDATVAVSP